MDTVMIIGYIAGSLTTLSFVPQVVRSWRLKEIRDISFFMLLLFALGVSLWAVYGVWMNAVPIIAANLITLLLILFLIWMKLRYK